MDPHGSWIPLGEPRAEPQEAHDELAQLRQQLWQGTNGWDQWMGPMDADQWIPIEAEVIHHGITLFHQSSTVFKSLFQGLTFAK